MKLTATLFLSFSFAVSAFGVSSDPAFVKKAVAIQPSTFHKDSAVASPLFRDAERVRGGAVPGWAAYNQALDDKPLITKAMTSLVGWALGDLLAQVCIILVVHLNVRRLVLSNAVTVMWISLYSSFAHLPTFALSTALYQWGTLQHEAFPYPLGLWIHLPRSFWTLLLQLARQQDQRKGSQGCGSQGCN